MSEACEVVTDENKIVSCECDDFAVDPEDSSCSSSSSQSKSAKKSVDSDQSVGLGRTVFNIMNNLLGAGILSVPSTFNDSGIVVSILLLTVLTAVTHLATIIVIVMQIRFETEGMDELAGKVLGKVGKWVFSIACLIFNESACLAYLAIGADFIISWFAAADVDISSSLYRGITTLIYGLAIPVALTIPRSLTFLSYFSVAAISMIVVFIIVMIYESSKMINEHGLAPTMIIGKIDLGMFSSLSIYTTSFALPISVLPLLYPYRASAMKRSNACLIAVSIAFGFTVLAGILGYLMFGTSLEGNILNTFSDTDPAFVIVRIGFFIVVSTSFPVIQTCCLCSWSNIFFGVNQASKLLGWRRGLVLIVSCGLPLIIAIFLPEMKPAIEVGGAMGGCLGNLAIPGLVWFFGAPERKTHWKKILAMALTVFGVISCAIGTYLAVLSAIDAFKTVSF